MRRVSKHGVVVGLTAFLLALVWWLPAQAYAGLAECPLQPGGCIEEGVAKYVALGSAQTIAKLGSIKFLKVR